MTMVERVARALHEHWIRNFVGMKDLTPWEKLDPMDKVFGLGMAEAAIEAMHEPSAEMTQAAADRSPSADHTSTVAYAVAIHDAAECWYTMISAALSEKDG